ncbi:MAG: GAF domain-containing sensor histidine kinase [Bryobacterales bacterium]|nr:GAF domain-containing sensor histidine kinase [Bryobacteraceae bacterium]MDW8129611.1 GAF domain-containing sensor histidine kinase [Bryobacterales bacterium]
MARALAGELPRLERLAAKRWRDQGFKPAERRALAQVSSAAAAAMLAAGGPLADYFEQVDYHGRRLAKLEVAPGLVAAEMAWIGRQMDQRLRRLVPGEASRLQAARRQLDLAALLVLHQAYYRVRESEAQAFHELFCAELQARSHGELIARCLDTVARWSRADAAALYLRLAEGSGWLPAGCWPGAERSSAVLLPGESLRRLGRPRQIAIGRRGEELVLDARWRRAFATCWSVPLREGRKLAGVLQLGFRKPYEWLPRELRVLRVAADRILAASAKARLAEDLEARERQIRALASQMVHVEEAERQRISQELHDEAGQSLLCLRLRLEMLEEQAGGQETLRRGLAEARRLVERSIEEIRRLVADLSPAVLEHLGLKAALRRLASRFEKTYGIRVCADLRMERDIPRRLQRVLYRLVQECLTNAGKHSRAGRLNLSLHSDDKRVRLCVEDDGVGFRTPEALAGSRGFGLRGIKDRVELLGGRLELRSAPGRGTTVIIELPAPDAGAGGCEVSRPHPRQQTGER